MSEIDKISNIIMTIENKTEEYKNFKKYDMWTNNVTLIIEDARTDLPYHQTTAENLKIQIIKSAHALSLT